MVLRGYALPVADALLQSLDEVIRQSPFRRMETPGGHLMSVALSNCGRLGWTTDHDGYRYTPADPLSGRPWPDMPPAFAALGREAAAAAGFAGFEPDACLLNRYEPGARMSLHQDRNERDFQRAHRVGVAGHAGGVSFRWPGALGPAARVPLFHGDVVVWGGADRLRFHGVLPLKDRPHPRLGSLRLNLTLRKAG